MFNGPGKKLEEIENAVSFRVYPLNVDPLRSLRW